MVDIAIPALTEVTAAAAGDDIIIETAAGTRRISRENNLPRKSELTEVLADAINLTNDAIWFFDGTDNTVKRIPFFDAIFGNFRNGDRLDDFTLDPAVDGARPIECRGTFTTNTITLDGNTANIGGASFIICNFTPNDLTLAIANITLFVDGASATSATIRRGHHGLCDRAQRRLRSALLGRLIMSRRVALALLDGPANPQVVLNTRDLCQWLRALEHARRSMIAGGRLDAHQRSFADRVVTGPRWRREHRNPRGRAGSQFLCLYRGLGRSPRAPGPWRALSWMPASARSALTFDLHMRFGSVGGITDGTPAGSGLERIGLVE